MEVTDSLRRSPVEPAILETCPVPFMNSRTAADHPTAIRNVFIDPSRGIPVGPSVIQLSRVVSPATPTVSSTSDRSLWLWVKPRSRSILTVASDR